jgi:DNA-binding Xre family transcriptional regulator
MKNGRNGSTTLSPKEFCILQAVAGHSRGMHETALVKETGISLDELMTLRRDKYNRIRRSGLVQTLCAKLLVGLTDGDRTDRFGCMWITLAGLEAKAADEKGIHAI